MGIFGWSYPAGCNGTPYDESDICEICGNEVGQCTCPTCKVCEIQGVKLVNGICDDCRKGKENEPG